MYLHQYYVYLLFCCYECQPPPSIQYTLFNSLHYDDMDIIAVIYSTIAVIFFIFFDDRAPEYQKIHSDSIATPLLLDYNTYLSPLSTIFYTSSFTKSTIITIATILVTIHIKLFLILYNRGPIPSSFYLRYYDINHDFGVHPQSSTFFSSIYN